MTATTFEPTQAQASFEELFRPIAGIASGTAVRARYRSAGSGWLVPLALLLSACGSPFGDCRLERVEVSLPVNIERGSGTETATLAGSVAVSNLSVLDFEIVRSVLTGDVSVEDAGVIWTVPMAATEGWVSLAIDAPVSSGEVLSVGSTYDGAGWGRFDLPGGTKIAASVRDGAFLATSVTGTVEVLAVMPLRLRLDLTAGDASNATLHISGDATFTFVQEPAACD